MLRKATDPVKRKEQARKYRELVAPYLGGDFVEAVGAFERYDWADWYRDSEMALITGVFTGASREEKRRKKEGRFFDLPEYFLLAVTRDRVHAFSYGGARTRYPKEIKDHIADFLREDMSFSTADWDHVGVIELTDEGQKFRVEVKPDVLNNKKNPWAAEVVATLEAAGLSQ